MKDSQRKAMHAKEKKRIRNRLEMIGIIRPSERLKQHHIDYYKRLSDKK